MLKNKNAEESEGCKSLYNTCKSNLFLLLLFHEFQALRQDQLLDWLFLVRWVHYVDDYFTPFERTKQNKL